MDIPTEIEVQLHVTAECGAILKLCLGVMLFYQGSETPEKRNAILAILEEHAALTGEQFRWTQNPRTKKWKPLKNGRGSYLQPKEWLPEHPDARWSFVYHAGKESSDASDIEIVSYNRGSIHAPGEINYVLLQFPLKLFDNASVRLPELVSRWCSMLKPKHGYGGLCLGRSHGYEHEQASSYEYRLAKRFPGLDVRWPLAHSERLDTGIKGADWLTILSNDYVEHVGGLEAVKEKMAGLPVLEYEGGLILQAATEPVLGDSEKQIEPLHYKQIGAIVEPVRCKNYGGIHIGSAPQPKFSREEYDHWLARFSPE